MSQLETFISGINFRFIKPLTKLPMGYRRAEKFLSRYQVHLDKWNTILPNKKKHLYSLLEPILSVPRMSSFAIAAVINDAVRGIPEKTAYVNAGVWNGFTLLAGMVGNPDKYCIGIDNFSTDYSARENQFHRNFNRYKSSKHIFFQMDFREYFAQKHRTDIGVYFYDADHSYENQYNSLLMADPFCVKGSIMLIDDTNWESPRSAVHDFIRSQNGKYELVTDQKTFLDNKDQRDNQSSKHPTWWNGLMIIRKII